MKSKQKTTKQASVRRSNTSPQADLNRLKRVVIAFIILAVAIIISFEGSVKVLPNYPIIAKALHGSFILVAAINLYNSFMRLLTE